MLAGQDVTEAGHRQAAGNLQSALEEDIRRADGDKVVDSLHRRCFGLFLEEMFRGSLALGDGHAGVENKAGILVDAVLAQGASVAFLP